MSGFDDEGRSAPRGLHQWHDSDELHRTFQVVGQNVQAHFGTYARQRLRQEVRRAHPGFERAEGMFDSLPADA
jgi:hypothetical protein